MLITETKILCHYIFFFTPRKQRKLGKGILKCRMSVYLKNSNNMKIAFGYLVGTTALTTGRAKGINSTLYLSIQVNREGTTRSALSSP